jgi:hypothetical protein
MLPVRITQTITEGVLKGQEYDFHDSARMVLGRSPDSDIALPMAMLHRDISRHHCAFEIDPPTVRVRDLNASTSCSTILCTVASLAASSGRAPGAEVGRRGCRGAEYGRSRH